MDINTDLWELSRVVFSYPAIDNHAHAFLREEHKDAFSFEGLITEASGERALKEDATQTMACFRATSQLSKLFGLGPRAEWEAVKAYRNSLPYEQLCKVCMEPTHIQCILIDDGLGGDDKAKLYDYKWHDQWTSSPTKRIVRVETVAEAGPFDLNGSTRHADSSAGHSTTTYGSANRRKQSDAFRIIRGVY